MRLHHTLLTLAALTIWASVHAAEISSPDLMIVLPLDTAVVSVDSNVSVAALTNGKAVGKSTRRNTPTPANLVSRQIHPHFGAAIARAARGVDVIDSSAALTPFNDPDSSRFVLTLRSLTLSQTTRTVARRTIPPSPPGFDPATGALTPGVRRAYSEGPGLMTTLTATAMWQIRDQRGDTVFRAGTATGASMFRGDARREDWEHAARELAKAVLRAAGFSN